VATDYFIEIGNRHRGHETLFASVMYIESEKRIAVKVEDPATGQGLHAGKLIKEIAKPMRGSGGGQQHLCNSFCS
jgi:alanyl-tRNA synthetase